MKKTIGTVGCLLLLLSTPVRAQNVDFGVTTGFQFTFWGLNDIPNSIGRLGFVVGGHASTFLNDRFVIKSALLFSQKGTWFTDVANQPEAELYTLSSDYLSLPILAKFYVTKGLHAQAGPQLSYLLSSKSKQGGAGIQEDLKANGYVKSFDAGVVFGLGYEFKSTFTIGVNLDLSFIDLIDDREAFENHIRRLGWIGSESFPEDIHNWTWQFTFSYNFTKNRSAF